MKINIWRFKINNALLIFIQAPDVRITNRKGKSDQTDANILVHKIQNTSDKMDPLL